MFMTQRLHGLGAWMDLRWIQTAQALTFQRHPKTCVCKVFGKGLEGLFDVFVDTF